MKVTQIYDIMNNVTNEVLGKSELIKEDLSNIVDVGTEIFESANVDNYVKSLVNHIGKVIFVDRVYSGSVPSILMDSWEYGSIVEKISCEIPKATTNDTWALNDGQEYKQDIFHSPKVSAKFFNSKVTFEVPMSFTTRQVKESFDSATQLNSFISMIENSVNKSMTIKLDSLIMRTINNMTALTMVNDLSDGKKIDTSKTGVKAINLLALYNKNSDVKLTIDNCLENADFIRFATYYINLYIDRVSKISTLFNIGKRERFTPKDDLHLVLLSDFEKSSEIFLQSNTFHNDLVKLNNYDTVPYWQATGLDYNIKNTSAINITCNDGTKNIDVDVKGVIGVMFDRDCIGVTNLDRRVTTNYNARAEFYNNYYKFDAGYYNDTNENYIVFFVG